MTLLRSVRLTYLFTCENNEILQLITFLIATDVTVVVCPSVCKLCMLSVTLMQPAKAVGRHEVPYGRDTCVVCELEEGVPTFPWGDRTPVIRQGRSEPPLPVRNDAANCQSSLALIGIVTPIRGTFIDVPLTTSLLNSPRKHRSSKYTPLPSLTLLTTADLINTALRRSSWCFTDFGVGYKCSDSTDQCCYSIDVNAGFRWLEWAVRTVGEVKFHWVKSLRKKSKTQVWSKTQLKTELDLVTKTESKNILRPSFGLRLLS